MGKALLSEEELAEYGEFKRYRREKEISFTLHRLVVDASRREADREAIKRACEIALKIKAESVLVSPVNVLRARRLLAGGSPIRCCVGGTGESLISIKRAEAKKAVKQGSDEIRLTLCYSALIGGEFSYLKREIKRVRRVVKKRLLLVALDDMSLSPQEISLGVRAACAAKADGVVVHGDTACVLAATETAQGKLSVEASDVENSEQLRMLIKAGAVRASTLHGEKISEELYAALMRTRPACEQGADNVEKETDS